MNIKYNNDLLKKLIVSLAEVWQDEKDMKTLGSESDEGTHFEWDIGWRSVKKELPILSAAGYSKAVLTVVVSMTGKKSIMLDRYDWDSECWGILHSNGV